MIALPGAALRSSIHEAQQGKALGSIDTARCQAVIASLVENDLWQIPTLSLITAKKYRYFTEHRWHESYQYLPSKVRAKWQKLSQLYLQKTEEEVAEVTYYVRNKDLIPEIQKFNECGLIGEELGRMLLLIAKNLSNKANFINYTWKEDMVQEAVLTCCKYLKNFDLKKSNNPFAYITTICSHAFVNYINKQCHSLLYSNCCFSFKHNYLLQLHAGFV